VTDCAALVRHAVREAVRPHTAEWVRLARLPQARLAPELRDRPAARSGALPLFLIDAGPPARHGEFADARTIVRLNARWLGRDTAALQPGDLLYFHQPNQTLPDHLMVFVGSSPLEPGRHDWVVYHTGPDAGAAAASAAPAGHDGSPRAGPARRPAPLAGTRGRGTRRKAAGRPAAAGRRGSQGQPCRPAGPSLAPVASGPSQPGLCRGLPPSGHRVTP
jgi:hypothetical protein